MVLTKHIRSLFIAFLTLVLLLGIFLPSSADSATDALINKDFALLTAVDERFGMDANNGTAVNGSKLQISRLNWTDSQRYHLKKLSNGYYAIIHSASGKAVDVTGGVKGSGVKVQLYDYNGTDAQQWKLISIGNGKYYIKNKLGYYLDVEGGNAVDGTQIQVYTRNQTKAQQWKLLFLDSSDGVNMTEGLYSFSSALNTRFALDLTANDSTNGANIQLWEVNGTPAQLFDVKRVFGNWYTITHHESGKAVDVTGGQQASGVNVEIWEYNGVAPQLYKFIDAGNGYYYIRNIMGYNIDVTGGKVYNGNNIQVYTPNKTAAQKWLPILTVYLDTVYFPACSSSCSTITIGLNNIGVNSSYSYRSKIAVANNITNYKGTAAQNNQMLSLLKQGTLVNPDNSSVNVKKDIVAIALSEVGTVGGAKYWAWYQEGFKSSDPWCACFVSWCAEQCGYINKGAVPKFAYCPTGAKWFKDHKKWENNTWTPTAGSIIFFDWQADGTTDHTGIVRKCENGIIYTIEGNSSNRCREKQYNVGDWRIYGYGRI